MPSNMSWQVFLTSNRGTNSDICNANIHCFIDFHKIYSSFLFPIKTPINDDFCILLLFYNAYPQA